VLVTGATGRLGRDLTARLEERGATPLPLVLEGYPDRPKSVPWIASTPPRPVRSRADLEDLPTPDAALHLHWKVDRTRPFGEQVEREVAWNVTGPAFLWEWLRERGTARIVNGSSVRVFSPRNRNPIDRDTEPLPTTPYGVAKLAGEAFLGAFFEGGADVVHVRLGSVCSHGEHPSQLMTRLVTSVLTGERIRVNRGHVAHLLYIDDAVDALLGALTRPEPGRYLAVGPAVPIVDVAALVEREAGRSLNAEYVDLAPGVPDPEFVSDLERLREPWARRTVLQDAARRMLDEARRSRPTP